LRELRAVADNAAMTDDVVLRDELRSAIEVGEHRGSLGSPARIGTADFNLPGSVSYSTTAVMASVI
jgi:hypothetical protein